MKILWVSWANLETTRRVREAAVEMEADFTFCEIADLSFAVGEQRGAVLLDEEDVRVKFDVLVLRAFYPHISEALSLAQLFAETGKPVIDACLVEGSYIISKMHNYSLLARLGIPVPRTRQLFTADAMAAYAAQLGYPVILKGVHGGGGTHVYMVEDEAALRLQVGKYPVGGLLVQEYIPGDADYRVMVVGGKALPMALRRTAAPGDFRTNAPAGGSSTAVSLDALSGFKEIAIDAANKLNRACAGVDIRLRGGKPVILEVNRLPNFVTFERKTGLDVAGDFLRWMTA